MKTMHPRKQSGSSLVVVMSVLATLMVIVGVAAEYTWTVNRHVQRSNTVQSAVTVGDACIEMLFSNWRRICSNPLNVRTPLPTSSFSGIAIPLPTSGDLNLPNVTNFAKRGTIIDPNTDEAPSPSPSDYDVNYTISNYKVIAVTPEWTTLASGATAPIPMLGQVLAVPSPTASPTTSLVYNYIASADVTLPALGKDGRVVAKVRRVFQKQQMSPWNFAIFYVDPLEIHPGPPFTVTGWVHTNSDLYTGHDTLTFADKVTYGSDWFVNFMTPAANPRTWVDTNGVTQYAVVAPGDTTHPETPQRPNYPGNLPPARDQALQPFGLDSTSIFSTTDTNPNNDSYHELIEPTNTSYSDPLQGQRYWDQADIIIQVSDNPNASAPGFDGVNGHDLVKFYTVDSTTGVTTLLTSGSLYNMFRSSTNAIKTNETIYDGREQSDVRITTLDISQLENASNTNSPSWTHSFGGIVYMYNTSATATARRGIRLKNGKTIPSTGLTVASNNPVYVQGDFNVGIGNVPSNSTTNNDPSKPQATDPSGNPLYTRAPSSVVADAVTILSNAWDDTRGNNSGDPLSGRVATNTTVNTAIISGIVPSNTYGDGAYSGGAENFPRFLEQWEQPSGGNPVYFTYYGSMVELYQSKQAIGKWTYGGNVYGAPNRQWYFDSNFKTKPPPGSLMIYSYIKGKWSVL